MDNTSMAKVFIVIAYVLAAAVGTCYLAAGIFFLLNKTVPHVIEFDTWYRYWGLYGSDGLQGKRLVHSALAALGIAYLAPLVMVASSLHRRRSLHGDARWATDAEIRKADLL